MKSSSLANSEVACEPSDDFRVHIAQQQLPRMEALAEGEVCRQQGLLQAIGEVSDPCGNCDRCLRPPKRRDWSKQAIQVLAELEQFKGITTRTLLLNLSGRELIMGDNWGWLARRLVQEELISESNDGLQKLYISETGRSYLRSPWTLKYAA